MIQVASLVSKRRACKSLRMHDVVQEGYSAGPYCAIWSRGGGSCPALGGFASARGSVLSDLVLSPASPGGTAGLAPPWESPSGRRPPSASAKRTFQNRHVDHFASCTHLTRKDRQALHTRIFEPTQLLLIGRSHIGLDGTNIAPDCLALICRIETGASRLSGDGPLAEVIMGAAAVSIPALRQTGRLRRGASFLRAPESG